MCEVLAHLEIISAEEAEQIGKSFYAYITILVFKYLLNGKLTSQKKKAFREEANLYIASNLGYLEGK